MEPGPTLPTQATRALSTQWQLAQICQLPKMLLLAAQMLRQLFRLSQEVAR